MVSCGTQGALLFFIIPLLIGSEKIIIRLGASKETEFIPGDIGSIHGKRYGQFWLLDPEADVCHAYQILRKGGLKDEKIIVFMYDDIAFDINNPKPGVLINKPNGNDVYHGVPKDYTGRNCTVDNFFAVILGNKSALTGGNGKVVDSALDDHIFIYYSDHGSAGIVGMPFGEGLYANDLIDILKKKHDSKTYKKHVTAANAVENSWGTYCPGHYPTPPSEYDTCLGDLFSISWMEDSDLHDLSKETLKKQYQVYHKAPRGSKEKAEARKKLRDIISHTRHVDRSINQTTTILFGEEKTSEVLKMVRPSGQPLVDDWNCLKMLVKAYEKHCGQLTWYGKKYTRAIANMCNAGVSAEQMMEASIQACFVDNTTAFNVAESIVEKEMDK
ncbi:hypothetical protein GH714_039625 [Hevea brasiliensis]|uniref:Legumain prodomain domain-containing protein n=1 Tax=Hevea brasiliensis TaxID=3981 RepID=A0A6A6MZ15_HEVBR|nr:hypothetical protein GH714_039625 [Hevea brasiliensis]